MDSKIASKASGDQGDGRKIVFHLKKPTVFWAIALAYGAYAIHIFGRWGQQRYLSDLDVHSGMFEKSMDWIMATGFDALANRLIWMFEGFKQHVVAMVCAALFVGVMFFLYRILKRCKWAREKKDRLANWHPIAKDAVESVLAMTIAYAGVPIFIIVLTLALVIPMAIGSAYGHAVASHQREIFLKGCENPPPPYKCVTLSDENNKQLSKGFVIESSSSQVAIFDVDLKRGEVFDLNGKRLAGFVSEASKPALTPKRP